MPSPATPGAISRPRDRRLLAAGGFEGELGVELDPSADHHLEWLPGADTELVAVKLAADVQDEVTAVAPVEVPASSISARRPRISKVAGTRSSPSGPASTAPALTAITGWVFTSRKSALRRCRSRGGIRVVTELASITISALDSPGPSSTVPATARKRPFTW